MNAKELQERNKNKEILDSLGGMTIHTVFEWPEDIPTEGPLTDEQKQRIMDRWRFSGYRPGTYQAITGVVHP